MKIMVIRSLFLLFTISLFSCGDRAGSSAASDSLAITQAEPEKDTAAADISGCYRLVSGLEQRDTSLVHLMIEDSTAAGYFTTVIYGKDQRKGIFKGTIFNGLISAIWVFSQEGTKDSLPIIFHVKDLLLEQKKYSYDPLTGREYIADTSGFTAGFEKIPCSE